MKQHFDDWNKLQTMIGESASEQNLPIFRNVSTNTNAKHASLRFIRNSMFDEENYAKEIARRQEDKSNSTKPRSLIDKDIEVNYYATEQTKRESTSLTPLGKRKPLAEKDGGMLFDKNNVNLNTTTTDRPRLPIRNNHFKKKIVLETNFEVYGFKGKELEDLFAAKCSVRNLYCNL